MISPISLSQHPAFQVLSAGADSTACRSALDQLAMNYSGAVLVQDPTVVKAIARLGEVQESAENNLISVSVLLGLGNRKREFKKIIELPLKRLLTEPPAPLLRLEDVSSRATVANYLARKKLPWLAEYLAREITKAPPSEKIQQALMLGLLKNVSTVAQALIFLREFLISELDTPGISEHDALAVARSVFASLRKGMEKLNLELGRDFGVATESLIDVVARGHFDGQREVAQRVAVANEAVGVIALATSISPAILTDDGLFRAVKRARGLTEKTTKSQAVLNCVNALRLRVKGAITLLAKERVWNQKLFENLKSLEGGHEPALKVTQSIVRENPGLWSDVQLALNSGCAIDTSLASSTSDEHALAVLLLRAYEYQLREKSDIDVGASLAVEAIALARTHGLETLGSSGELVKFDPSLHRLPEPQGGVENVRIVVPAVVQKQPDESIAVVINALVRPT